MHLAYHSYGDHGKPLIILHGLLGSSDNWHTVGKKLGDAFRVFALDARNHGRSPHDDVMTYEAMAEDVREFLEQKNLTTAYLLGHSMGGKIAMHFALRHPEKIEKLVVVDIAPRAYDRHHDDIFDAIASLDLHRFSSRSEISKALSEKIPSETTRQFVMKNLARSDSNQFTWKINLPAILKHYDEINSTLDSSKQFGKPTLFVKSTTSGYITMEDEPQIKKMFPNARIVSLDVGHWIHAEAPEAFTKIIKDFLTSP
ncbi:MAG TPA: alpha/beta fold hydrolase [Bacteroidota bacterium]|nr:alpha/beta fold hydrolase [Bacteroidota bacterium]